MSGGMEEVFGRRADRPDHPDFWRLSQIVLGMDAGFDEKVPEAIKEQAWKDRVDSVVDRDTIIYMARQRAARVVGFPVTREQAQRHATLVAFYVDAFVAGAKFQAAGGHQD